MASARDRMKRVRRALGAGAGAPRGALRRCVVLLPTFNRPQLCLRLLADLEREREHFEHLVVLDDCSSVTYETVHHRIAQLGGTYLRWDRNRGKRRYFETINRLFDEARARGATEIVQLADDVRLCRRFFERVREGWDQIRDPQKALLNFHLDKNRVGKACWTGIVPHRRHGGICSGWTDGLWYGTASALELVGTIDRVDPERWEGQDELTELSSGVWQRVSQRIVRSGRAIYQSERSLVVHVASPSVMNTRRRRHVSIPTHDFVGGPRRARRLALGGGRIVATMASIPERRETLRRTLDSLLPQVDQVALYLNYGTDPTPGFVVHPQVSVYRADATGYGDLKDMGKFYPSAEIASAGYVLSVDDDLIYAPDYAERLLHFVEIHQREAAVGYHGVELLEGARANYYRRRRVHHCLHPVERSAWVHILGTGVLAFARERVELPRAKEQLLPGAGMADVWFGALAQRQQIPLRVIAHRGRGREVTQQKLAEGQTLYAKMKGRPGAHRRLLDPHWPWILHTDVAA